MRGFSCEPGKNSFKGLWLGVTRWKVADQFRKREKAKAGQASSLPGTEEGTGRMPALPSEGTARTSTVERIPDSGNLAFEAVWDSEWRQNLLRAALERVKRTVNPAHYEMYHLHVVQGLAPRETARALGVSTAAVYLAKHRVGKLIRAELKRLEAQGG